MTEYKQVDAKPDSIAVPGARARRPAGDSEENQPWRQGDLRLFLTLGVKVLVTVYLADVLLNALFIYVPTMSTTDHLGASPLLLTAIAAYPLYRLIVLPVKRYLRELEEYREELEGRLATRTRELQASHQSAQTQTRAIEEQAGLLKNAQEIMQRANERFFNLFSGLPAACFTCDSDGVIFEFNEEAQRLFGIRSTQVLLQPMYTTFVPERDREKISELISRAIRGEKITGFEWHYTPEKGPSRWLQCNVLPVQVLGGEVTGAIMGCLDVSERKHALRDLEAAHNDLEQANAKLKALATTDSLTDLPNHRALQDHLRARLTRRDRPFALVMADVDRFKEFNDTYGHPAGDEVLRVVGQALKRIIRKGDIVARYGGEEFCLVLEAASYEDAVRTVERLRREVASADTGYRTVTSSFGLAMLDPTVSQTELIQRADDALYQAKAAGRNCVVAWSPEKKAAA
ncbi:MAG: diguanylate cyclase [Armatimonadetes bacterium]|nr:diguanylate cyclase [Armatimonadota bacterium]